MKIFAVAVMVTLCLIQSFGQRWNPARLVLPGRDTLRGEAILRYDTIRFRTNATEKSILYGTADVSFAYLDNTLYASSDFIGLPPSEKMVLGRSFFMKVLLLGDIDLYYHVNRGNRTSPVLFFIRKGEEPALQLIRSTTSERVNGQEYRRVNEAYRDQLKFLFSDCPSVVVDTRKDYYKEKPMLDLVQAYLSCKNNISVYRAKIVVKKPQFAILGGMEFSNFSSSVIASGSNSVSGFVPKSSSSSNPFVGIQLALSVSKNDQTSLISEVMFSTVKITGEEHFTSPTFQDVTALTNIQRSYIRFNEGVRRSFRVTGKVNGNIHLGFSISSVISSVYDVDVTTDFGSGTRVFSKGTVAQDFSNPVEIGYLGGVGLSYGKLGLIARFERTLNIINNEYLVANLQNIYVGVTYRLK